MLEGKKIVVVMPAFNAARTLEKTYGEIPRDIVDEVILTDDGSRDETVAIAKRLGLSVFAHERNKGYGANQKTCYREALRLGADVVIMLHPDYQYTPKLIRAMASLITCGVYDVVLGSRILGNKAISGGMPVYKYFANRVLTLLENALIGEKLSEYHTGYRAFRREVLELMPLHENSDDFVFDNQMLLQAFFYGYRVAEITCPALYNEDASSINLKRSIAYGCGVLATAVEYALNKWGIIRTRRFAGGTGARSGQG